ETSVVGRRLVRRREPAPVSISVLPLYLDLVYLGIVPLATVPFQSTADAYSSGPGRRTEHPGRLALRHRRIRLRHRLGALLGPGPADPLRRRLGRQLQKGFLCLPAARPLQ